jgi:hypothetical protein
MATENWTDSSLPGVNERGTENVQPEIRLLPSGGQGTFDNRRPGAEMTASGSNPAGLHGGLMDISGAENQANLISQSGADVNKGQHPVGADWKVTN